MVLSQEAETIINQSQYPKKLKHVIKLVASLLGSTDIRPTAIQWTVLINHLNEMILRSETHEQIPPVDVGLFSEISAEALTLAGAIVDEVTNLPVDEKYVLSIHFETAKTN